LFQTIVTALVPVNPPQLREHKQHGSSRRLRAKGQVGCTVWRGPKMANFVFLKINIPGGNGVDISVDGVDAAGVAVGNYGNIGNDGIFHGFIAPKGGVTLQQRGAGPLILSDPLQLAGTPQETGRTIHSLVGG
jgi:hypothetical protein